MNGLFAALSAAAFSTFKDLVSKKLASSLAGIHSAFASFLYALPYYVVVLSILYLAGAEEFVFSKTFFLYVGLRALTDAAAEWLKMKAFSLGDISYVSSFLGVTPAFVLLTSPLLTGDSIPKEGVFSILLIVVGGIIITYRPGVSRAELNIPAILTALASAFFFSLNVCFDRLAVQEATPAFSGFAMTIAAALVLAPFALRNGNAWQEFRTERKALHVRGFLETLFMTSKLLALQYLPAQYVAGLVRVSLVFTIVAGRIAFNEEQFLRRFCGGVFVVFGVLGVVVYG